MTKYFICNIDREANAGKNVSLDTALRNIINHIKEKIDPTFPDDQFERWVDSDSEKPFRWNKRLYFWDKNSV